MTTSSTGAAHPDPSLEEGPRTVDLAVGGMTCASCAARIERKLNRLPGVSATVNYATERASVSYGPDLTPADLVSVVEATGYTARLDRGAGDTEDSVDGDADEGAALRPRLLVSVLLALPVVLLSMVPSWQFDGWQWV
jgi:Cu+-exporting ATPase